MNNQRWIKWFYGLALLLLVGVACFQCKQESDDETNEAKGPIKRADQFKNLHDSVESVGMQTCRQCHENVYQNFKKTGMGQSFGPATREVSDANFEQHSPVYDSANNMYYYPYWQDSTLFIKEYRLENGDTVHQRVEQIDHIIGSGHHTNSHMYSVNGYLYQAPLTYYTQKGQWDLAPGFEQGNNSRFSRAIEAECMTCHNMYPKSEPLATNKYYKIPDGIECERCHGPGELHVKQRKAGKISKTPSDTDHTIVNPAKLPTSLKNDVCQRCHLQGNAVLKKGQSFFDFKPGMALSSVMTVFRPEYKNEGAFIMASHSERMQESECFKQSRKSNHIQALNCISCHNPHKSVRTTADAYFNKTCKSCHNNQEKEKGKLVECAAPLSERKSVDNNCIECHMPSSGSVDIPHVTITDHNIRVPDSSKDQQKTDMSITDMEVAKLKSYNEESPSAQTIAKAYLYYYEKFRSKPKFLDSANAYLQKIEAAQFPDAFIQYHYLKQDYQALSQLVTSFDTVAFENAQTYYRTGQAYANLGNPEQGIQYYRRAVEKKPFNLDYRNKLAGLLIQQRNIQEAKSQLLFVQKENPKIAVTNNNLGFVYLVKNELDLAKKHIDKAIDLNPDYPEAYINKAKLYLGRDRIELAKATLNTAKKRFPSVKDEAEQIEKMMTRSQ